MIKEGKGIGKEVHVNQTTTNQETNEINPKGRKDITLRLYLTTQSWNALFSCYVLIGSWVLTD